MEMTQNCIAENARIAQDQGEYQKRYNGLVARYDAAKARFDKVTEAISAKEAQAERLAMFERTLKDQTEPVADDGALVLQHLVPHMRSEEEKFDERLWGSMVDEVTVGVDGGMTVVFRDGTGGTHL